MNWTAGVQFSKDLRMGCSRNYMKIAQLVSVGTRFPGISLYSKHNTKVSDLREECDPGHDDECRIDVRS
jgi:hypothetical protein